VETSPRKDNRTSIFTPTIINEIAPKFAHTLVEVHTSTGEILRQFGISGAPH